MTLCHFSLQMFIPNGVSRDECNAVYFIGAVVSLSILCILSIPLSIYFQLIAELLYVVALDTTRQPHHVFQHQLHVFRFNQQLIH